MLRKSFTCLPFFSLIYIFRGLTSPILKSSGFNSNSFKLCTDVHRCCQRYGVFGKPRMYSQVKAAENAGISIAFWNHEMGATPSFFLTV